MGRDMMGGSAMRPCRYDAHGFRSNGQHDDGTIEFPDQAAHERIFKAMDSNKDGKLIREEMQAFMQGTRRSIPPAAAVGLVRLAHMSGDRPGDRLP